MSMPTSGALEHMDCHIEVSPDATGVEDFF